MLQLAVQCTTSGPLALTAYIGTTDNTAGSLSAINSKGSGSASLLSCPTTGWTTVSIGVTFSSKWTATVSKSSLQLVGVRVVSGGGSVRALVNYDSPNAKSALWLAVAP